MEEPPLVLVIGSEEHNAEELVKLIVADDNLSGIKKHDGIVYYPWKIDNKYYSLNIQLCSVNSKKMLIESLVSHAEGIILFKDQVTENDLKELHEWSRVADTRRSIIRLYVSRKACRSVGEEVEDWCVKNQFEFVEIDANAEERNLAFECEEVCGINRVIEVLQAHHWPSLTLKKNVAHAKQNSSTASELENSNHLHLTNEHQLKDASQCTYPSSNVELFDDSVTEDWDKLSTLFQNLQSVKHRIASLSREEKLKEAEIAVKAFWRAVDGDEEEISDDDDNSKNVDQN